MVYFFQLVVSGIVVGSIYALSALGFVLIYKSSKVLNIAHGQIIASGAFIAYALTVFAGIHIVLSFLLSMVITFFLAMSVERIFLRRLIGEPIISVIMVTIGLMSIIDGIIYLTPFGAENFSFPEFFPKPPISGALHVLDPNGGRGHHVYNDRRLHLVFQKIHRRDLHAGGFRRSVRLHVHRYFGAQGVRPGLGHRGL
jgi:branched-subunit amino acid ABC-type transport system permease component